jgi:hypothetical protein
MTGIVLSGSFAIAATVWQSQNATDHVAELTGTTTAPQPSHRAINRPTQSDLTTQVKELEDQVRQLEATAQLRTMPQETAEKLVAYLQRFSSRRVVVSCIPNDIEAYQYANQILNILKQANWDAQGPQVTRIFGDVRGPAINVYVNGDNHSDNLKILLDGFTKFNIPYQGRVTPTQAIPDTETVELFVGGKHLERVNAGPD